METNEEWCSPPGLATVGALWPLLGLKEQVREYLGEPKERIELSKRVT